MLHHGIIIVLGGYSDIAKGVLVKLYGHYRYNRLPRHAKFIAMDRQDRDDAEFQARVGSCLEHEENQALVEEFTSLWTYFCGDIRKKATQASLLATVREMETGHEIFRIVYYSIPLVTTKSSLLGPLPTILRPVPDPRTTIPGGMVSLFLPCWLIDNYPTMESHIQNLTSRFPDCRTNRSYISFRIPAKDAVYDTRPCYVYTVPNEVLYFIFTMVAQDDGDAPLTLRAMCRQWQEMVDARPSLWTYHSLNTHETSETRLEGFLERGEMLPIHVHLAWCDMCGDPLGDRSIEPCDCPNAMPILAQPNRIECLRIGHRWMDLLSDRTFSSLKTLTIYDAHERRSIGGVTINPFQFPVLTRLDLYNHIGTSVEPLSGEAQNVRIQPGVFPGVRILRVTTDDHGYWSEIVSACSRRLTSLEVGIVKGPLTTIHRTISFPRLQCLVVHYGDRENPDTTPAVRFSTPQLVRVCIKRTCEPLPHSVGFDVHAVVQLRLSQYTLPWCWPSLRLLQIKDTASLLRLLAVVGGESAPLPSLERVELLIKERMTAVRWRNLSVRIADIQARLGGDLRFVTASSWPHKMRGYDGEDTVRLWKLFGLFTWLKRS